jgi:hypothetical protein
MFPLQCFCTQAYQATYTLYWHGIRVGKNIQTVTKINPDHFLVEWHAKPLIPFLGFKSFEKSEFYLKNNRIYPVHYIYDITKKHQNKAGELDFHDQANLHHKGQDKISAFFQLTQDLMLAKKTLRYTVIEPPRIKIYHFHIIGETVLKTPLGMIKAIQIQHFSDHNKRLTKLWLAKDLDYLLIKFQQFKKEKMIAESNLEQFTNQIIP